MTRLNALTLIASVGSITACTVTTATEAPTTAEAGPCRNEGLDRFLGRKVDQALGSELLKASGAKVLRWGPPGSAMTMDFRPDRLTVSYDETMAVTRASCG